jgi:LysM domain
MRPATCRPNACRDERLRGQIPAERGGSHPPCGVRPLVPAGNKIFEANKPMLTHPDKIYPGQVLRIPD